MKTMMFKSILSGLCVAGVLALGACSVTDPKLEVKLKSTKLKKIISKVNPIGGPPAVDILFVIDDSGSMTTHQATLSNNINQFVSSFFNGKLIDYHIGVINTSVSTSIKYNNGDGKLIGTPPFIEASTPNALAYLQKNLIVGTSGSGTEMLFKPVQLALTAPVLNGWNKDFYRDDATLAIVMITDAEDQSDTVNAPDFYNFLLALKGGNKDKIVTYSVIVPSTDPSCPRDDSSMKPVKIENFMTLSGGITFSLCDPNYGQKLADLGKDLFRKVIKVLRLSRAPLEDTITVRYGTQVIPHDEETGWRYDPATTSLYFGDGIIWSQQPAGTQLDVNFTSVDFEAIQQTRRGTF